MADHLNQDNRSCPFCVGSGTCVKCHGRGLLVLRPRRLGSGAKVRECHACEGSGVCGLCGGVGHVPRGPCAKERGREADSSVSTEPWTAHRKAEIVLEILRGDSSHEAACRVHGIAHHDLAAWTTRFLEGGKTALSTVESTELDHAASWIDEMRSELGRIAEEIRRRRESLYLGREPLDPGPAADGRFPLTVPGGRKVPRNPG